MPKKPIWELPRAEKWDRLRRTERYQRFYRRYVKTGTYDRTNLWKHGLLIPLDPTKSWKEIKVSLLDRLCISEDKPVEVFDRRSPKGLANKLTVDELIKPLEEILLQVDLRFEKQIILMEIKRILIEQQKRRRENKMRIILRPRSTRMKNKELLIWIVGVLSKGGIRPSVISKMGKLFPKSHSTVTDYRREYNQWSCEKKKSVSERILSTEREVRLPSDVFDRVSDRKQLEKWKKERRE